MEAGAGQVERDIGAAHVGDGDVGHRHQAARHQQAGHGGRQDVEQAGRQVLAERVVERLALAAAAMHGAQALERPADVAGDRDRGQRDLVAGLDVLDLAARRYGHHGDQRLVGQFALGFEVLAYRPADRGEEDVIDRRPVHGGADLGELGQRQADGIDDAVRGKFPVEARLRLDRTHRARLASPAGAIGSGTETGSGERLGHHVLARFECLAADQQVAPGQRQPRADRERQLVGIEHLAGAVADGPRIEFDARRFAVGDDGLGLGGGFGVGFRGQRVQGANQLGSRLAIDRGMVHLDVEGEAAGRHAGHVVEALDDVGFP